MILSDLENEIPDFSLDNNYNQTLIDICIETSPLRRSKEERNKIL